MKSYKILFCDLDGTLIQTISGNKLAKGIWDMQIKFEVLDAIKAFAPEHIIIVTNQGGIQKGYINQDNFNCKLSYLCKCIEEYCNISTLGLYCSSNDKNDSLRKPNPGMLEIAYNEIKRKGYESLKSEMLMIGDASGREGQFSDSDKRTAHNFGIDYIDVNDFVMRFSL